MKADLAPAAPTAGLWSGARRHYSRVSALPLSVWAVVALLNLGSQIGLRRALVPGEFGTLNAILAAVGLFTVPLFALHHAMTWFGEGSGQADSGRGESLRAARLLVMETFTWIWAFVSVGLLLLLLYFMETPRLSLDFFALLTLLIALGGVISWTLCQEQNRLVFWAALLIGAAVVRCGASVGLARQEPWAESGLAAVFLAGFFTLAPAMRAGASDWAKRWDACRATWDRKFLLEAGAALSVLTAIYLFANADRIAALRAFGGSQNNNLGLVETYGFDAYQAAGLIARSLLWATLPLLWMLFIERLPMKRTTVASLMFLWIYLGALVLGVISLCVLARPVSWLFSGPSVLPLHHLASAGELTAYFLPTLAVAMLPLGLLQAVAVFSLASRRHPECFVIGGCSVIYALILFFYGHRPDLMAPYMFGTGGVALMIVLFVGVIRWGRKQP